MTSKNDGHFGFRLLQDWNDTVTVFQYIIHLLLQLIIYNYFDSSHETYFVSTAQNLRAVNYIENKWSSCDCACINDHSLKRPLCKVSREQTQLNDIDNNNKHWTCVLEQLIVFDLKHEMAMPVNLSCTHDHRNSICQSFRQTIGN